ncbi:RIP metalloprotease RseP [Patescibacteria group bacterium]
MFISIITFFIVLSILVLVHELGHFTAARRFGVKVEEFGLGLPPRIVGKKINNTIYSLNWLPIGGFVKLAGEDDDEKVIPGTKKSQYFWAKSKKQRAIILSAGVIMNFFLAYVITTGLLIDGVREPSGRVRVEDVAKNSPAQSAGIKQNDYIISIKNAITTDLPKEIHTPTDLIEITKDLAGKLVSIKVQRGDTVIPVILTPRVDPPEGEGSMGVTITDLEMKKYSLVEAPWAALKLNIHMVWLMLTGIFTEIWRLISMKGYQTDIAGPIGIAQVTARAVSFGFRAVLEFTSMLSLNLAVLNILPIPALDGGRLLFVFAEKLLGKKVKPAFEKHTHQIGMILLLFLVLIVSINDIMRLARGG